MAMTDYSLCLDYRQCIKSPIIFITKFFSHNFFFFKIEKRTNKS